MAKLLAHYDFASLTTPKRIVPDEEALYVAIGDPMRFRAPDRFVDGVCVSYRDTLRMRVRAFAARVFLARRLARLARHDGLAASWAGTAREDLYMFRLLRQESA